MIRLNILVVILNIYSDNLFKWLEKLNVNRTRSPILACFFRNRGNDSYGNVAWPDDFVADYYTQAIFSSPKDCHELPLAHANRAACFLRNRLFVEVPLSHNCLVSDIDNLCLS